MPPHHLVNVLEPSVKFDVFSYIDEVKKIIETLEKQQKPAVFVGGTTYYFKALVDGFDDLPAGSDEEREKIITEIGEDPRALHDHLKELDPKTAATIHRNNRKKIIRAIEVCRLSGKPFSSLIGQNTDGGLIKNYLAWSIHLPRDVQYDRINKRVDTMLKEGALEEVRRLWEQYGNCNLTIHQALGVRQLMGYFEKREELDECIRLMKRDTRRFSKRQLSFLRGEPRIHPIHMQDYGDYRELANALATQFHKAIGQSSADSVTH